MSEHSDSPDGKPLIKDSKEISAGNSLTDTEAWGHTESSGRGRFPPGYVLANRYRIVSLLGKGGMGIVYRADDLKLAQPVALKFIPSGSKAIDSVLDEVRLGRQISHPNVCRIHDIIEIDGQNFIAMEYVEGEDLASLLRRIGPLPKKKGMDLAREICAGLAAAHDLGIVHRDLKPGNIMVDSRGHARITDFGLATLMKDFRTRDTITGTPVYMAPEQIRDGHVSPRTDIYSLGLVLYEMFTGERFVKGRTLPELQAFHASNPQAMSNLPADLDSSVIKMIGDCLATDPEQRPSSVRSILSHIPGGDPIEAAIAEGETPSPEMVAAALVVGDLKPKIAWLCLLATVFLLLMIALIWKGSQLAPFEKSPAVLAEKAREIIAKTGYDLASVDRAHAFSLEPNTLSYFGGQLSSSDSKIRGMFPGTLQFVYRQSPLPMIPSNRTGMVTQQDPPLTVPGMAMIHFDSQGRLVGFQVIAEPGSNSSEEEPDWNLLLEEAGLRTDDLKPAQTRWSSPPRSGTGKVWFGQYPTRPDVPIRIEASADDGKPTFFRVSGIEASANQKKERADEKQKSNRFYKWIHLMLILTGICIPIPIARRNYRLGRADRKGSMRLAVFVFLASASSYLFRIHLAADPQEYILVRNALGQALFFSVMTWVLYTALEPYLRRRFPHTLTGWKRLLDGRFRDPLVGREVLLGTMAGLGLVTLPFVVDWYTGWRGTLTSELAFFVGSLKSVPYAVGNYLWLLCRPIFETFLFVFLLLLFRVTVRNKHVAHVLFVVVIGLIHAGATGLIQFPAAIPFVLLAVALMVMIFLRWGFFALVMSFVVNLLLLNMPITVDVESWYFGRSLFVLLTILAFALYGFRTSLSGKPAFGKLLFED